MNYTKYYTTCISCCSKIHNCWSLGWHGWLVCEVLASHHCGPGLSFPAEAIHVSRAVFWFSPMPWGHFPGSFGFPPIKNFQPLAVLRGQTGRCSWQVTPSCLFVAQVHCSVLCNSAIHVLASKIIATTNVQSYYFAMQNCCTSLTRTRWTLLRTIYINNERAKHLHCMYPATTFSHIFIKRKVSLE